MRPFGIWVAGCWLCNKFLLEAVGKALSLDRVGSAAGVDAGATLSLGVVDLSGLLPDLAGNERVVCVTICAVVATCLKDTAEALLVMTRSRWCQCLKDNFCCSLHLK